MISFCKIRIMATPSHLSLPPDYHLQVPDGNGAETRTVTVMACENERALPKNTLKALAPATCTDSEDSLGRSWHASSTLLPRAACTDRAGLSHNSQALCPLHNQRLLHGNKPRPTTPSTTQSPGTARSDPATLPGPMGTTRHL